MADETRTARKDKSKTPASLAGAPAPLGAYSHARVAGNLLYLAGQGARDANTGVEVGVTLDDSGKITGYDIKAQTHAVIKNMTTVLHAYGLDLTNLVDVSVFLANMDDFSSFNSVYSEYFTFPEPPTRTTIQAARLPGRNFIEIKAIALMGKEND
jgi:reactive intermediate/imine deaminase